MPAHMPAGWSVDYLVFHERVSDSRCLSGDGDAPSAVEPYGDDRDGEVSDDDGVDDNDADLA